MKNKIDCLHVSFNMLKLTVLKFMLLTHCDEKDEISHLMQIKRQVKIKTMKRLGFICSHENSNSNTPTGKFS